MLVWFQRDDELTILRDATGKKTWRDAQEKTVSAEGVLRCLGKGTPRLIMDNTSVFLSRMDEASIGIDGKLVRVTGKLVVKNVGDSKSLRQSEGAGMGYFIEIIRVESIERIKTYPLVVEK